MAAELLTSEENSHKNHEGVMPCEIFWPWILKVQLLVPQPHVHAPQCPVYL